eukprot:1863312-Ditylum_brightwellii.AAC.2
MFWFCIWIKAKLGAGSYNFVAKVFNIKSAQTLNSYEGSDCSKADMVMWDTLGIKTKTRDHYYTKTKIKLCGEKDFRQHGSLAGNLFTIKDKIVYDFYLLQMKGFVDEFWNSADAIAAALASLSTEEGKDTTDMLEAARHYFVIFSVWSGKEQPFTLIAARFTVKNLSYTYLYDRYLEKITALSLYGFVATSITGDGASENRSMLNECATVTVGNLIEQGVYSTEWKNNPLSPNILVLHFGTQVTKKEWSWSLFRQTCHTALKNC